MSDCPECGTPLDDVPFGYCATHEADAEPERPPELGMEERPFAPLESTPRPTAEELGFVDRAATPVGQMRRSIHRSHRGEGNNFVD